MNNNVSKSSLNRIIPPEIKNDEFYRAIQRIVQNEDIKTVLEIGSSSGEGSTEALVTGLRQNPNQPILFCLEISKPRFAELQNTYKDDGFVKCYNVSSVSIEQFADEEEVIKFYKSNQTNLNYYPLEQVISWLHQDIEYIKQSGVSGRGIAQIKEQNNIDFFDVALIDGSEFTGSSELEEVYGAKYIILDDINTFKNYYNLQRLYQDSDYTVITENNSVRNGFAIFKKRAVQPISYTTIQSAVEAIQGFMVPGQEEYLFNKVKSLPNDAVIVEIGSYKGRSTVAMSYACIGTNRKIYCIDTWDGNDTDFSDRNFFEIWQENLVKNGLSQYVVPLRGYSHQILSQWEELTGDKAIDFIFIDGSHQFLDVLKDYEQSLPLVKDGGWIAFHDVVPTWPGPERVWHNIAKHRLLNHEYSSTLACGQKNSTAFSSTSSPELPIHFFTIVLNGEPFIEYHIEVFKQLPYKWHWHIVEGVADLKHDTAWSLRNGGRITDEIHSQGRSNDGTAEYLDELAQLYPENVTVYRKPEGIFWEGKREMVSAPLENINQECLLWQLDVDELWTIEQICTARQMFINHPEKTSAFYWCWYFVGENLVISTRNCYAQNPQQDWLRTWRFKPGAFWASHEPPRLVEALPNSECRDVAAVNPFLHEETEKQGLVFQHFAYVTLEQLRFKQIYYGYKNAVVEWMALQAQTKFPVGLGNYFSWVQDETMVDTAESLGIAPIAPGKKEKNMWNFVQPKKGQRQTASVEKITPRVIVDGVFFQLYNTGISRVWRSLLEEWVTQDFAKHIIVLDRAGTAPKIPGISYGQVPAYDYEKTDSDREMLQQVCDELEADLFISTYYTTPLSTPSVFIAYDMTPEVFETNLDEPMWREKHYGIRHASAYITISHNTASDLLKFFPDIAPELVTVAHCGVPKNFSPASPEEIESFKIKYNLSKPYFMMVGAAGGHKNAPLFLQAFAQLPNQPEFDIVCTAHSALTKDEFEPYTSGSTVHKLPLSDEELKAAFSGAVALVYPSQYEGFGLPILEAMACGCPVITCPNASIPEVAGEAALYVKDDDVEAMAIALINIQKPEVREALIAAGIEQAKKFSWSKMSKEVSYALIQASLLPLKLRNINFIIFPDWEQAEETIFLQMEEAIGKVITHSDSNHLNLLIDTSNLTEASEIDADLVVSGAVMSLMMKEDTNISTAPEITILGRLSEVQWKALLSRVQARISMERENIQAIADTKALALPLYPEENCDISGEQVEAISMDSSRDLKDRYTDYVYHNCPSLDANSLARVATILESTCWEEPTSSRDLNNFAVLALIVAEQSEDLSERQLYLNMALEALNQGIEQDSCPLCRAHLALLLTMTGEMSQAIELAFPALINTVPNVYSTREKLPSALVYLPSPRNSLVNTLAEQLTPLLQARDAYTQAFFLLSEVLCRTHLVFYGAGGLRLLNLAENILPDSSSIKFKLGVSCMVNNLREGLVSLHQAKQLAPQSPQIFQALYLAYRDIQDRDSASYWLNEAREFYKKEPTSPDWKWTTLGVNSSITYLPVEKKLLLAVEPSFRSIVTAVLLAEGDWFEKEMEFWRNSLKPGMTVIDVGANVGVYTFTAARRVGPRGRVLAVEPFSGCLRCLEETCRINELDWVKICGGAASDRIGTARLHLYTASELNEIVTGDVEEPVQLGSFEEVPCFTLDSLVEQENVKRVDYLKIDAEGHEMSVLIGSEKILTEFFPIILYENIAMSKGSNLPVADYLKSKGYKLFRYQPYAEELIPINSSDELEGNLNVIAVPDSKIYLISQS